MRSFRDFTTDERRNYITLSTGEYYPDILEDACRLYLPVLETFSGMLHKSESSTVIYEYCTGTQSVDAYTAFQSV